MSVQSATLRRRIGRFLSVAFVATAAAAALGGCPIYSDDDCSRHSCVDTTAYCSVNSDCSTGYVCTSGGRCVEGSANLTCSDSDQCGVTETCGRDQYCHTQDCSLVGCAQGTCLLSRGIAQCVVLDDPPFDAGTNADARANTSCDAGDAGCTNPNDASTNDAASDAAAAEAH